MGPPPVPANRRQERYTAQAPEVGISIRVDAARKTLEGVLDKARAARIDDALTLLVRKCPICMMRGFGMEDHYAWHCEGGVASKTDEGWRKFKTKLFLPQGVCWKCGIPTVCYEWCYYGGALK